MKFPALELNPYAPYLHAIKPGDSVKLMVNDGVYSSKVWVKVVAALLPTSPSSPVVYAGVLEQHTHLDIKAKQRFLFQMKHIFYILG